MKKKIVLALSTLALAASALPAAAATTFTADGFLRDKGMMTNFTKGKDEDPDLLVEQRLRLRFTFSPTEYVKVVYFGEVDFQWGDASYNGPGYAAGRKNSNAPGSGTRNQGGGLGGDTVNLETKQLYGEVKFANTPLTMTVGLQGFGDNWDLLFLGLDAAALKFNVKSGISDVNVFWAKFVEGNRLDPRTNNSAGDGDDQSMAVPSSARAEDDADLYGVQLQLKPTGALKVGADLYYFRNQGSTGNSVAWTNWWPRKVWTDGSPLVSGQFVTVEDETLYYAGLNAAYNLPFLSVSGWGMYNFGTVKLNKWGTATTTTAAKLDDDEAKVRGLAASANVVGKFAGASIGMRGLYFSGMGTDPSKSNSVFIPWGLGEPPGAVGDNLMLLIADAMTCTYGNQPGYALADAAYAGFGLLGGVLSASYVPPSMKDLYIKASAGTFRARNSNNFNVDHKGKNIGTEISARLGYKFMGSVDVSINGATAWLGDFYDETVDNTTGAAGAYVKGKDNPDRPYIAYVMTNIPF